MDVTKISRVDPRRAARSNSAIRCLTILNERGDTTLTWTEDRDESMAEIIAKKMSEGVAFFIIEPRGGRMPLKTAKDAMRYRALAIPDADFAAFVGSGSGELVPTPDEPVRKPRRSKNAKEVAAAQSVAVKPVRGG